MSRYFLSFFFVLFSISLYSQSTYYVAPSSSGGSDSNNGSIGSPFETIQYGINQLSSGGDILYIRAGTYRETITINKTGSNGNPITIEAYSSEEVTIDGTVDITGSWTSHGNGIYKLSSYSTNITQLFVDDEPMVNARWPNAQFNDDSVFSHSTWAQGDENTLSDTDDPDYVDDRSINGSLQIDEDIFNPGVGGIGNTSLDLNSSIGILNIGSFKTWTVAITGHTQNASSDDIITYNTGDIGTYKDKHHYYFFEGKLSFLDTNNEWFHDKSDNTLYVYPDYGDLSNRTIKGKTTDYSVTFSGAQYVTLKKINFFATTFEMTGNSDYNTVEECNFYYPSASKRMLGTTDGLGTPNVTELGSNADNNTIEKCLFENTEGEALVIKGDTNTIKNNYFHHIDWSASELQGLMVSIYCTGTSNIFQENTIHTTGASATVLPGRTSTFSYNKVTNTGLLQSDGAVFQGTKNYVQGSVVHHNFIYDTEKYAFRYDAPGGDATQAGSYGIMHHNIADNTNGLMIKGNNQIIAHNTILNTINNRNDIIILSEDCSNNSTYLYNNLAKRIGAHRSATSFSLTSDSPMPMAGNAGGSNYGYIKVSSSWRACQNGDSYYNATAGSGSSQNNIDEINVSRTGLTYNSDVESLLNYNSGDGKTESDYNPTSNTIIDQGVSPTSTPSNSGNYGGTGPALNNLVPHTNAGSAADIGAFEVGESWTAGADWSPKFYKVIWKTSAGSTAWNTASNWSTGVVPDADNNITIPAGASNMPVVSSSVSVKNLTVNSSATLTVDSGVTLTVNGNLVNMGNITVNGEINVNN
ncbi:hypothetical protein OA490_04190 [Flavobacteriales bacterium]|nr:hypothetical protein [Flavobacteriales bacterium]